MSQNCDFEMIFVTLLYRGYSVCYYMQTVKWDYAIGAWKGSPRSTFLIFFLLKGQEFI